MTEHLQWFEKVLDTAIRLYFRQPCDIESIYSIEPPADSTWIKKLCAPHAPTFDELATLMLALAPHLRPQSLDVFLMNNSKLGRPYTQFGGWKGTTHSGFLPTGETAVFLLCGDDPARRENVIKLLEKKHWFHTDHILRLENAASGEPLLSGLLCPNEDTLARLQGKEEYHPEFSSAFPAREISTPLQWEDAVLEPQLCESVQEINHWISQQDTILHQWGLSRILKPGYRCLFYGPPGTGKTLVATLLGKHNHMPVYRIDLSSVISKYIGETEKNLAHVFEVAQNRRWILFFDEADALFSKRSTGDSPAQQHANTEVAYLLQRIEDFPGVVILATNLRSGIDPAFFRRFQSSIYFPTPGAEFREELWRKMLPSEWLASQSDSLMRQISRHELSPGAITNVIGRCALHLAANGEQILNPDILKRAIGKELYKEGKI